MNGYMKGFLFFFFGSVLILATNLSRYTTAASIMSTDRKTDDPHSQLFEEGLKVRRAVIGDEYVERSLKNATAFTQPGQQLVTEGVWGTIWTRPGLDLKQRSLISEYSFAEPG